MRRKKQLEITMEQLPPVFDAEIAACFLQVGKHTIYRMVREGKLHPLRTSEGKKASMRFGKYIFLSDLGTIPRSEEVS